MKEDVPGGWESRSLVLEDSPSLPGQTLLGCGPRGWASCCVLLSFCLPARASLWPPLSLLQGLGALPEA